MDGHVLDRLALVATLIKALVLGLGSSVLSIAPGWVKPFVLVSASLALAACVVVASQS